MSSTSSSPSISSSSPAWTDTARWAAVQQRDAGADGQFVYAVRTTGVYCRPSCPSRRALRENVGFYADGAAAAAAGYRPCRRCKPDAGSLAQQHAAVVADACRRIEASDEALSLDDLSAAAGLSRHHFHRMFKSVTGLTPKAYADAHRARRVRQALVTSGSVTEAIYDAGFESNGPFYARTAGTLGMTPGAWRRGGADVDIRFAVAQCSLGALLVAASDAGVCAITLGDDPDALVRELQDRFPHARLQGADRDFDRLVATVVGFVEAPALGLDLPLDLRGTAFQQRVWQALREVPAGATVSYAQVAARVGAPKAVRAVAQACAANTLAVAVPCHRVVRQDGQLSGYRWGVERKRTLLDREAA